jgi:hypothetical protein
MPAQSGLLGLRKSDDAVLATQKLVEHINGRRPEPLIGSSDGDLCAAKSGERNKTRTSR